MNIQSTKIFLKHNIEIKAYDTVSSTNIVAKELAQNGAEEFTVVTAKSQTNGKGRLGRSFISNSENGLYMSMILRPNPSDDSCVHITALSAVAVLEAIKETSNISPSIKWINDIYINEKKVCGILAEASFDNSKLNHVIVGIGVNILPPKNGFDDSIKDIATSIYENESPSSYKELLCAKIIDKLIFYYQNIESKSYMRVYKENSNIIGKSVDVYRGNDIIKGIAIDINEKAELVVKTEKGDICVFNSGEARVRKQGDTLNEK